MNEGRGLNGCFADTSRRLSRYTHRDVDEKFTFRSHLSRALDFRHVSTKLPIACNVNLRFIFTIEKEEAGERQRD